MTEITIGDEVVVAGEIKFKNDSIILTGRKAGKKNMLKSIDEMISLKGSTTDFAMKWFPTGMTNVWQSRVIDGDNLEKNMENIFSNSIYWDSEAERHRLNDELCREACGVA